MYVWFLIEFILNRHQAHFYLSHTTCTTPGGSSFEHVHQCAATVIFRRMLSFRRKYITMWNQLIGTEKRYSVAGAMIYDFIAFCGFGCLVCNDSIILVCLEWLLYCILFLFIDVHPPPGVNVMQLRRLTSLQYIT